MGDHFFRADIYRERHSSLVQMEYHGLAGIADSRSASLQRHTGLDKFFRFAEDDLSGGVLSPNAGFELSR